MSVLGVVSVGGGDSFSPALGTEDTQVSGCFSGSWGRPEPVTLLAAGLLCSDVDHTVWWSVVASSLPTTLCTGAVHGRWLSGSPGTSPF